ncbi:MAG: hypothetical protein ACRC1K_21440 [Planctomycetia bacterium]
MPDRRKATSSLWLTTAVLTAVAAGDALGCPTCGTATTVQTAAGVGDLPAGFAASILFMLAIPATLAGGFAAWLYFADRGRPSHPAATSVDDPFGDLPGIKPVR